MNTDDEDLAARLGWRDDLPPTHPTIPVPEPVAGPPDHGYHLDSAAHYTDGSAAIVLFDGPVPVAKLSIWTPQSADLPPDVFYVKHWSENAAIIGHLIRLGYLRLADRIPATTAGYVVGVRAYTLADPHGVNAQAPTTETGCSPEEPPPHG